MHEAMMKVYHPTEKERKEARAISGMADFLSKPATLKNLCQDSLRKCMRNITGGRTIRPLVRLLEKSDVIMWGGQKKSLPETLGNFLLCDPPENWREEMVRSFQIQLVPFILILYWIRSPT